MQHEISCPGGFDVAARASSTLLSWPLWGLLITVLTGLLLGGHQREAFAEFSLFFSYG